MEELGKLGGVRIDVERLVEAGWAEEGGEVPVGEGDDFEV